MNDLTDARLDEARVVAAHALLLKTLRRLYRRFDKRQAVTMAHAADEAVKASIAREDVGGIADVLERHVELAKAAIAEHLTVLRRAVLKKRQARNRAVRRIKNRKKTGPGRKR